MLIAKTLTFYKRQDVREALVEQAKHKEISVKFDTFFGKRPEALYNDGDVLEFAKQKATSFHASEELWSNPLHIKTGMGKKEIADLRIGWDLILDIDCPYWPLSKLITHLFIKALQAHEVKAISVKFSGNKGFHIGVPFEAFPDMVNNEATKDLFPEAPRRIAHYLLDYIAQYYVKEQGEYLIFDNKKISKKKLAEHLGMKETDFTKGKETAIFFLCKHCGHKEESKDENESRNCKVCGHNMKMDMASMNEAKTFDPFSVVEVDTILIAHRHLYRMPYSFHEKSGLVSIPVPIDKVLGFSKKDAEYDAVRLDIPFLDRKHVIPGEASQLFIAAYDFKPVLEETDADFSKKEYEVPEEAIPEQYFPPCMLNILKGVKDGRKRSLFTLINFLRGCGWSHDQITARVEEWNKVNDEPLREVIVKGRLRYEKGKKEALPPHNCRRYYEDFQVCEPDHICNGIKNPLQYAKQKAKDAGVGVKKGRIPLTEEQKALRKKFREEQKEKESEQDDVHS